MTAPADLPALAVPHPSVFIREEREARGWSQVNLAVRMGGDETQTNLLSLDMYEDIGPHTPGLRLGEFTANQLSKAFGVSAAFFLALEQAWLRQHLLAGEGGR
jgi:hypothetical protein